MKNIWILTNYHDLEMVRDLCERTLVMKDGMILSDEKTEDIFRDKDLLEKGYL